MAILSLIANINFTKKSAPPISPPSICRNSVRSRPCYRVTLQKSSRGERPRSRNSVRRDRDRYSSRRVDMRCNGVIFLAAFVALFAPIVSPTHCPTSVASSCPKGFSYLKTERQSSTWRSHQNGHCKPDTFNIFSLFGFLTASFTTVVNIVNNININNNNNNNNNMNNGRRLEEGLNEILRSGAGIFDPRVITYLMETFSAESCWKGYDQAWKYLGDQLELLVSGS